PRPGCMGESVHTGCRLRVIRQGPRGPEAFHRSRGPHLLSIDPSDLRTRHRAHRQGPRQGHGLLSRGARSRRQMGCDGDLLLRPLRAPRGQLVFRATLRETLVLLGCARAAWGAAAAELGRLVGSQTRPAAALPELENLLGAHTAGRARETHAPPLNAAEKKMRPPLFKTRITELLGIRHPILCGGMGPGVSDARYVAAVVNAGGMGFIMALGWSDPEAC